LTASSCALFSRLCQSYQPFAAGKPLDEDNTARVAELRAELIPSAPCKRGASFEVRVARNQGCLTSIAALQPGDAWHPGRRTQTRANSHVSAQLMLPAIHEIDTKVLQHLSQGIGFRSGFAAFSSFLRILLGLYYSKAEVTSCTSSLRRYVRSIYTPCVRCRKIAGHSESILTFPERANSS
jgi:hypothetical protein